MTADKWTDFEVVATGGGEKLERWGKVYLLRPDPQVIWRAKSDLSAFALLTAKYVRDGGGGRWERLKPMPDEWHVSYGDLTFLVKPMGFKHTGLFPEQAANWDAMRALIAGAKREIRVLNLFAYTGGATAACAKAGARVTHVDAAKGMVERAKTNCALSDIPPSAVRYIVDDCVKFVRREIKRGAVYDAVIMDPPSYGRGPNGETWKIEDSVYDLVALAREVLSPDPLFFLINSYTTGLSPTVMCNILNLVTDGRGKTSGYGLNLPTAERGVLLPSGASAMWTGG
ncbi:MAG: class I SAM-dependent methyltransferase [Clostridiales bacterium]|jgi:23S rRNA (cytosine1962-C5)-methyltransferase|nr:class I SAM-dependent methyltransferase [Clostridiales bacterium]